jgi:nucleoside-diphosphate-sugar epimerase
MLSGEKILITGVTGMVPLPIAEFLARDNEVWGIARFTNREGGRSSRGWACAPARSTSRRAASRSFPRTSRT